MVRTIILSAGIGMLLVGGMWLNLFSQQSLPPLTGIPSSDTQVLSTVLQTGVQQVVLVDSRNQTMAVYHIEPQQGKIQLRSVRSLRLDLIMEEYNPVAPEPSKMKLLKP